MSQQFLSKLCLTLCLATWSRTTAQQPQELAAGKRPIAFAHGGKFKMLYDCRQRPQSVLVNNRLYLVYNGDARRSKNGNGSAYPMLITYRPADRSFSKPVRLSQKRSSDHHDSPIIWADEDHYLHVLFGCHKTPGTHLISSEPVQADSEQINWTQGPQIAPKISYPTVYRIHDNREVIYYRTDGHTSSWTYRISADNGRTWSGPKEDVTDLDRQGRLDWSSYQTKIPSQDGKTLHVVYTDYDDNKHSPNPQRFFNPRYQTRVSNEWKYNLSYVKINLQTHAVQNATGKTLRTPVDIDYSKENCQIWDTQWRGAGIPPVISLDKNGEPTFLHILSEGNLESHRYYYVRRVKDKWIQTPICQSNHQWNSGYLTRDKNDVLHAYVIVGDGHLDGSYMEKHGGGRIEQWISKDQGNKWQKLRDVTPDPAKYPGWYFNNVQPVVRADGSTVEGMLLFYGWPEKNLLEAKAFLLHE